MKFCAHLPNKASKFEKKMKISGVSPKFLCICSIFEPIGGIPGTRTKLAFFFPGDALLAYNINTNWYGMLTQQNYLNLELNSRRVLAVQQ